MNIYDVGDRVIITATFKTSDGVLADPSSVSAVVRAPDGTIQTFTAPAHPSTGYYEQAVDPSTPGNWRYKFVGTGTMLTVQEGMFYVRTPWTWG